MHFAGARSLGLKSNRKQREERYKDNDDVEMEDIKLELGTYIAINFRY
jgi:hypothetical protein